MKKFLVILVLSGIVLQASGFKENNISIIIDKMNIELNKIEAHQNKFFYFIAGLDLEICKETEGSCFILEHKHLIAYSKYRNSLQKIRKEK